MPMYEPPQKSLTSVQGLENSQVGKSFPVLGGYCTPTPRGPEVLQSGPSWASTLHIFIELFCLYGLVFPL